MIRSEACIKDPSSPLSGALAVHTRDATLLPPLHPPAQNLLCTSAKFSLNRAGKQSGVNPRRYIDAATTYAMTLYLQAR